MALLDWLQSRRHVDGQLRVGMLIDAGTRVHSLFLYDGAGALAKE